MREWDCRDDGLDGIGNFVNALKISFGNGKELTDLRTIVSFQVKCASKCRW